MNDLEKLLAIESIKQTKARYFRSIDTKDWEAYASTLAPDAQFDVRESTSNIENVVIGREKIVHFVSQSLDGVTSVHHGHTSEIYFTTDTRANVIWAMEDNLWSNDSSVKKSFSYFHGWGILSRNLFQAR